MRHRKISGKLSRTTAHRKALLSNLVKSLIAHERIFTTLPKAKIASSWADRMVSLAKQKNLSSERQAVSFLTDRTLVKKLFKEIGPRFQDRQGGYTRVIRLDRRPGDRAYMAALEWVVRPVLPAPEQSAPAAKAKKVLEESKA